MWETLRRKSKLKIKNLDINKKGIFISGLLFAFGLFVSFENNPDWNIYKNIFYTGSDDGVDKKDYLFKALNKLFLSLNVKYEFFRVLILLAFSCFIYWLIKYTKMSKQGLTEILLYTLAFCFIRFSIQIREGIGFVFLIIAILRLLNEIASTKNLFSIGLILTASFLFHSGLLGYFLILVCAFFAMKFKMLHFFTNSKNNIAIVFILGIILSTITPMLAGKIYLLSTSWQNTPIQINMLKGIFWGINFLVVILLLHSIEKKDTEVIEIKDLFLMFLVNYFTPLICFWIIVLLFIGGPQSLISALARMHFLNLALVVFYNLIVNKKSKLLLNLISLFVFSYNIYTVFVSLSS
jgi:hypothetical protein